MARIKKLLRMILHYPARLFNGISPRATVIDSKVDKKAVIEHHANVRYSSVGRYTYVSARSSVIFAEVGSFCSIAAGVGIGGGAHDLTAVSTSPVFNKGRNIFGKNLGNIEFSPYKTIKIGNDVWIGNRALILQGITIGDGAVVGAGSVVTKDVEPYTIVAGNPARVIRRRFDDETIERLLKLEWWNMPDEELKKCGNLFGDPQKLTEYFEEKDK
ncbi:MAG: CatB-related O-acetyltransferase [Ruminococcaceae bacterium]|nr:CatB-related O-acetyltransferase [Oscillospiraceae bacterium]